MKNEMTKEMKVVLKSVDKVLQDIKSAIPEKMTPQQVGAIFNLFMSMYE